MCSVSFAKDIFPNMKTAGAWRCADASCHATSVNGPVLTDDAKASYDALVGFALRENQKPFIKPCSTNPDDSSFACNLEGKCGPQMPQGLPAVPTEPIRTWLQCGAPFN